jgi:hypothetical protein
VSIHPKIQNVTGFHPAGFHPVVCHPVVRSAVRQAVAVLLLAASGASVNMEQEPRPAFLVNLLAGGEATAQPITAVANCQAALK